MASALTKQDARFALNDIKKLEKANGIRYELIDGQPVAMAGAKKNHTAIVSKLIMEMGNHLEANNSPCFPYAIDLKVIIDDANFYYPDIVVDCGDSENSAEQPKLIVEVLSTSTQAKDKTKKFDDYKKLPTLLEYAVIEQDFMEVIVYRQSANWSNPSVYHKGDTVNFESLGLSVAIEEIYRRVKLDIV